MIARSSFAELSAALRRRRTTTIRAAGGIAGLGAALLATAIAAQQESGPAPHESGLTQEVEVRFVVLDALVLGPGGKIVSDLIRDDFELYIDLQPHPVASVDLDCPRGAVDDPRPVEFGEKRAPVAPRLTRQVVHVVDYTTLPQTRRAEVLDQLAAMVRDHHTSGEELMIAAVTRRLRVEQPFSRDRDEILATIERMRNDPSLWQEHVNPFIDSRAMFDAMVVLVRMLARHDGAKAVVLYSDLPTKIEDEAFVRPLSLTQTAFDYDRQFDAIAEAAMDARVAIYPVHARGLAVAKSSHRLARLAVDTGGRFSENTNDLSLAYVRAQRDLACRYAIGFYDRRPEEDTAHRVNLRVRRRGLRVVHATRYRFGSREVSAASLTDTAYSAPAAFRDGAVRGRVFAIRPTSRRTWEAAVALSFPVGVSADDSNTVNFGAKLDDDRMRAVHHFDSAITVRSHGDPGEQELVVVEPVELAPGSYDLSVVVNDPTAGEPRSSVTRVTLAALPRRGIAVTDPLLLRRSADGAEVQWSAELSLFDDARQNMLEPVFRGDRLGAASLTALTRVCWQATKKDGHAAVRVERAVLDGAGALRVALPDVELEPPRSKTGLCRALIDELPTRLLEAEAAYRYDVTVRVAGQDEPISRQARFELAGVHDARRSGDAEGGGDAEDGGGPPPP